MNCREARRQLWSERSSTPGGGLEIHLQTCGACASAASEVQRMRSWLHELPAEAPSAQFDWRLRLRLAQATREITPALHDRTPRWFAWREPMQFAMSTAVAALLVVTVGMFWTRARGPETPASTGQVVVQTPSTPLRSGPGPDVVQVRGVSALSPNATARSDSDSSVTTPRR